MNNSSAPVGVPRWLIIGVFGAMFLGLGLRLVAAGGGIWLDEAWSAVQASDVPFFTGVFLNIHHDNNHHLNSLWLQMVGLDAAPLAMRALSILAGTMSIAAAAWAVWHKGAVASLAAALFFAVSPMFVLYGSEARGYALFILILLIAIGLVAQWLYVDRLPPAKPLVWVAIFGLFSHLMMVPALFAIGLWAFFDLAVRKGWKEALFTCVAVFKPAVFATLLTYVMIMGFAQMVAGGMTIGGVLPFEWWHVSQAMNELFGMTTGLGAFGAFGLFSLVAGLGTLIVFGLIIGRDARSWVMLAPPLLLMPLVAALAHPSNVIFSRYYLLSSAAILLCAAIAIGQGWAKSSGLQRGLVLAIGSVWCLGSLMQFPAMAASKRGDSLELVRALSKQSPKGAVIALSAPRGKFVFKALSAQTGYPITIMEDRCKAAFLFQDWSGQRRYPEQLSRCGSQWRVIARRISLGPSGLSWLLYAREGLPSPATIANGAHPTR